MGMDKNENVWQETWRFPNLNFNTDDDFHIYAFDDETYIAWFVDNTEVHRATKTEISTELLMIKSSH